MKYLLTATLALAVAGAGLAQSPAGAARAAFPSCDLQGQMALKAGTGGSISDPRQAHISMRSNILQADIGSARKAGMLSAATAQRMWQRVESLRMRVDGRVSRQGRLEVAEAAAADRTLNAVARQLCRMPASVPARGRRARTAHPVSVLSASTPQA